MTPQELKASILQRAIQGKLVPQLPEEGTGEELYQQIQAEKQRLIETGKIKKEKPLPEITEDEIPFDIPESWKWVRWGAIVNIVSARRVHQSDWKKEGIPFYRAREIAKLATDGWVDNDLFISQELYDNFSKSGVPRAGDLMVTAVGTLGKTYIVKETDHFYYKDASVICFENYAQVSSKYLKYMMESELMKNQIKSNSGGTTVGTLTMVRMIEYLMPLPPLAEQKRIIAKIEELLPYIDRYEQAWSKLEDFNKRFPVDMQKSILQTAIQGKLVPQLPEEGTGEELYQQIQTEKQALIKAGVFKKDKALPDITDDDILFDIPDTWRWCYVGEIFDHNTGKAMNVSAKKVDKPGSIRKFITTSNLYWDSFDFTTVKEMFFSDDELARCTATKKDILMCEGGAYYGRTAIWNYDYDICFQNHIHRLRAYAEIDERFFYYVFRFYRETGMMQSQGTAMPGLSSVVLHNMMIPLPPLAEQKRIVAKLEEILPLCERLK